MITTAKKHPNKAFIIFTLIACAALSAVLILALKPSDRTIPNIVTIAGTVLTVGGLLFAIREQATIKATSEAIKQNTATLRDQVVSKSLEANFTKCVNLTRHISDYINRPTFDAVYLRLGDLKECLIECKKIVRLNADSRPETSAGMIRRIDTCIVKISAYCTLILTAGYQRAPELDLTRFVRDITSINTFIDEIRESQTNFVL